MNSKHRRRAKRGAALGAAALMLLSCLTGCSGGIKGVGGTAIDAPEEGAYDFTAAWVKEKSDFEVGDESWRLGTLGGLSAKITTGDFAGTGAWYTGELPANWVMHVTVSLDGVDGAANAAVLFGQDETDAALSLAVERDAEGKLRVSLRQEEADLVTTDWVKAEDTEISCILDNNSEDGSLRLYATGDEKLQYSVQTDPLDEGVRSRLKTFAFSADKSGVGFSQIAIDIMLYREGTLKTYAVKAMQDIFDNFWEGKPEEGYFTNVTQSMVWEYGMAMLMLETMYEATGDELYKTYVASEWAFMQQQFTDEEIARPGVAPNIACDDAAWNAMTLMVIYRLTGDQHALKLAGDVVRNSYEYWKDGSVENGIWYRLDENGEPIENIKSVYAAGLMLTALEYHEATKGTELVDPQLYTDTLALYNWTEEHLRRSGTKTYGDMTVTADDNLYFCDFVEEGHDSRPYGPVGGNTEGGIGEAGSCSALFGNMGMAAINAKLYAMTEEKEYREKAVATANSLAGSVYNNAGVLLNDRDAWTNAAFVRYWVKDVLTLDGVEAENIDLIKNTALSVAVRCRTDEGFYRAEWSGGNQWTLTGETTPDQLTTTATSAHMIAAGALAEKLGMLS